MWYRVSSSLRKYLGRRIDVRTVAHIDVRRSTPSIGRKVHQEPPKFSEKENPKDHERKGEDDQKAGQFTAVPKHDGENWH